MYKEIPMTPSMVRWLLFLVLVTSFCSCSKAISAVYKDPKQPIRVRVKDLMDQMTLEEKIGQMAMINVVQVSEEVMRNYSIGSIVSGSGTFPNNNASASPEDWLDLVNTLQKGSLSQRLGIPYIYAIDSVHGLGNVYRATIFPHNIGLGCARDPELMRKIGVVTALETRATGMRYVFAPCIAVCRNPRWGRCYESYSEDPKIVQEMTDIILGLQGVPQEKGAPFIGEGKVAACAKHYVGDGGTKDGINENNTIADWHGLLSVHMAPYFNSIIKGVSTVMISYSSWNGQKMHTNKTLITDFLKSTLKFKGFVISDWEGVDKVANPTIYDYSDPAFAKVYPSYKKIYIQSLAKAINAGIDMIEVPPNITEFLSLMTTHVNNKTIPMSRINDAVSRILRVKFSMGLFENPLADYNLVDKVGAQAHRDLAREAVRKSLVLLKNGKDANNPLIPLPKKASKILVAGTHANNLGYQCGGWTIAWQGLSGNNHTQGTTILNAISTTVDPETEIVYKESPKPEVLKSNDFSYAIVVVGEPPYAEILGDDLNNLTIVEPGLSTMTNVCSHIKCVVVLISGRPLVIEPYISSIDALVTAWLPGTEGQGVTDVLFGDYGFTGKLSRTWFKRVDQLPMNVGDKHYDPLFPFGFGLTTKPV